MHSFQIYRLKGLCDNVDSGPEQFQDHEICFSLRIPNQAVSTNEYMESLTLFIGGQCGKKLDVDEKIMHKKIHLELNYCTLIKGVYNQGRD